MIARTPWPLLVLAVLGSTAFVHADVLHEEVRFQAHTERVACLVCRADGKWVISACGLPGERTHRPAGEIRIWDAKTGKRLGMERCPNEVGRLALSHDGKLLAADGPAGPIRVWQIETSKGGLALRECHRFAKPYGQAQLAFSADSRQLAASGNRHVWLWDLASGRQLSSFPLPVRQQATFSPDLRTAATANFEDVDLWDTRTGKMWRSLLDHRGAVVSMRFRGDGRLLAVASGRSDGTGQFFTEVKLWDLPAGRERRTLKEPQGALRNMQLDSAGHVLILQEERKLGSVGTLRLLAVPSDHVLGEFSCRTVEQSPVCLALSSDGRLLAGGLRDGTVVLWRISGTRLKRRGNR